MTKLLSKDKLLKAKENNMAWIDSDEILDCIGGDRVISWVISNIKLGDIIDNLDCKEVLEYIDLQKSNGTY